MKQLALDTLETLRNRGLLLAVFPGEQLGRRPDSELAEEIQSELAVFLLENETLLTQGWSGSAGRSLQGYLRTAFIRKLVDRARTGERDPRRAFYKHVCDAMRMDARFTLRSPAHQSIVYSLDPHARDTPPLAHEDLLEIDLPTKTDSPPDRQSVRKRAVFLPLAEHFWQCACQVWGGRGIHVRVTDFVEWVARWVELQAPQAVTEDAAFEAMPVPLENSSAETIWDPALVRKWAAGFGPQLSKKEREVFALHRAHGLTLQEAAARLGYKGVSGPKYVLQKAEQRLRTYVRDLPWLSPPDRHEEAMSLFLETVFADLKKRVPKP